MTSANLALVFSPNVLVPIQFGETLAFGDAGAANTIVKKFIEQNEAVFAYLDDAANQIADDEISTVSTEDSSLL